MLSVGWRSGLGVTRITRSFIFTSSKMENPLGKEQPGAASPQSKVVCRENEIQEGELVSSVSASANGR